MTHDATTFTRETVAPPRSVMDVIDDLYAMERTGTVASLEMLALLDELNGFTAHRESRRALGDLLVFCLDAHPRADDLRRALTRSMEFIVARSPLKEVLSLDRDLRPSPWKVTAARSPWAPARHDAARRLAETTSSVTVCGLLASHSSGFVREAVVKELTQRGVAALPWLLSRCVDWVAPVRIRAATAVLALLGTHASSAEATAATVAALALASRLTNFSRSHSQGVTDAVRAHVLGLPDSVACEALADSSPDVRCAMFDLLHENQRLEEHHLRLALEHGPARQRLAVARLLDAGPGVTSIALCRQALLDGSGSVRALALAAWVAADAESALPILDRCVDDAHPGVRSVARWHLAKLSGPIDFAARYRSALASPTPALGAVAGLGEVGSPEDWEQLVPLLDASSGRARAAIRSLRSLNKPATRELRMMMVDDPRPGVSTEAARSVAWEVRGSDRGAVEALLASPHQHTRRHAIRLCALLEGWTPLILLLQVDDPALADAVRLRVIACLRITTARPATTLEREQLRTLLPKAARITRRNERELGQWLAFMSDST